MVTRLSECNPASVSEARATIGRSTPMLARYQVLHRFTRDAGNLNYPIHADCSPAFIRNDDRSKEARSQDNTNFPSPHRSPCGTAISIVCLPYRPCAFDACRARLLARLSFPEWISITLMGDSHV